MLFVCTSRLFVAREVAEILGPLVLGPEQLSGFLSLCLKGFSGFLYVLSIRTGSWSHRARFVRRFVFFESDALVLYGG